jgi:hypothetical protein
MSKDGILLRISFKQLRNAQQSGSIQIRLMEINRVTRIAVFLLALTAFSALWVLVGGQYHLDLMSWAWKLGFLVAASSLTVVLATASGSRALLAGALLLAVLIAAGWVTYYYHLNEPTDEDESTDQVTLYQTRQASAPLTMG